MSLIQLLLKKGSISKEQAVSLEYEVKSIKFEHTKEEEYGADLFGFKLSLEASYYRVQ